jgi:hypothetical protein
VRRANDGHTWRNALTALACTAATVLGGCAGGDGGYTSMEYGYGGGVYYGSAWNAGWYGGGPVYVGPPAGPPPGAIGGGRPPHVSNMPAPRPMAGGGGGGRRR